MLPLLDFLHAALRQWNQVVKRLRLEKRWELFLIETAIDDDPLLGALAHVVDRQGRYGARRHGFHFDARLSIAANDRTDLDRAGGSIHVYGALRGRAMAGSTGNTRARIFCARNEAELISIDGYYRTAEQIDASLRSRPTQCWLEDRVVSIAALN